MCTIYHAKYFAHELCKDKRADSSDRFSTSLFDATVDLNPHQIEAAMFAIRSPLQLGAILADEVGLGKTIEAGLVLCQYWAETKRRLLVICPASLRKQWCLELQDKFNVPAVVLDSQLLKQTKNSPKQAFDNNAVIVCSYDFANRFRLDIKTHPWDLVVIDEAHKLRNVYRKTNHIARNINWALSEKKKLLLTATPLQNSLMELYGLVSIVDEHLFGDVRNFRTKYLHSEADLSELRARLSQICKRTLRNQVTEYVRYTERKAITRPFRPTDSEHNFYEAITRFIERENTFSIPKQQRHLTELILRKLLASSSHAIAGTLSTMRKRLKNLLLGVPTSTDLVKELIIEEEIEEDYLDESKIDWSVLATLFEASESERREIAEFADVEPESEVEPTDQDSMNDSSERWCDTGKIDRTAVELEIKELTDFIDWAKSFGIDTKSRALLKALEIGFSKIHENKAQKRAVIFTESRRTQAYLHKFLEANGYSSKVILFNGTNTESESKVIYEQWKELNASTGRITGSKAVDIKTALIDQFRDYGEILLATEAAAEGINLQFCSLVINYDLPWNPQRIEQRIGRCHRYGQKHDVVVINFLNERNAADQRVLELLEVKFNLFSGVFGASDEVLGALESGLDFEKRIFQIYKQCRSSAAIDEAFAILQTEMDESTKKRILDTRRTLIENFDDDVHARLRSQLDNTRSLLNQTSRMFWELSKVILQDYSVFGNTDFSMNVHKSPLASIRLGQYKLISKMKENVVGEFLYRLSHPLGRYVLEQGLSLNCPEALLEFDLSSHTERNIDVEQLKDSSGWLTLELLSINSIEREQHLIFTGITNDGSVLDAETCKRLFSYKATVKTPNSAQAPNSLFQNAKAEIEIEIKRSLDANKILVKQEQEKLVRWAEDKISRTEQELDEIKSRILALSRQFRQAESPEELNVLQQKITDLENLKRKKRQNIFDSEDEINNQRDDLISKLERRLTNQSQTLTLFTIQWSVVAGGNTTNEEPVTREQVTARHDASNAFSSESQQQYESQLPEQYEGLRRQSPPLVREQPASVTGYSTEQDRQRPPHSIELRLKFDRDGFCRVSLLPGRSEGLPDATTVLTPLGEQNLVAMQDNWYQDVTPTDIGKLLTEGTLWSEKASGARWSLRGRELFVLAARSGMSGYVSQPCLELGKMQCVLCTKRIQNQVEEAILETGASFSQVCNESKGAPNGWVVLRDIIPIKSVHPTPEANIFNALRPLANLEICFERGIRVESTKWIEGYPPKIYIYGCSEPVEIKIDGQLANPQTDSSYTALGYDRIGQHLVWCAGTSKSYSIVPFQSSCEHWNAYAVPVSNESDELISICGPLVRTRAGKDGKLRSPISTGDSNRLVLGPAPGDVVLASSVSAARGLPCIASPSFQPVWAIPQDPMHCDKKKAAIYLINPNEPIEGDVDNRATNASNEGNVARWIQLVLDASRKGLRVEPDTPSSRSLWRSYKNLAHKLWRKKK